MQGEGANERRERINYIKTGETCEENPKERARDMHRQLPGLWIFQDGAAALEEFQEGERGVGYKHQV